MAHRTASLSRKLTSLTRLMQAYGKRKGRSELPRGYVQVGRSGMGRDVPMYPNMRNEAMRVLVQAADRVGEWMHVSHYLLLLLFVVVVVLGWSGVGWRGGGAHANSEDFQLLQWLHRGGGMS